jgi:MFS family permease
MGNILAGWTTYGTNLHMANSSWSWRLPTLVQCIIPSIIMALVMFFPESPRWLLANDRREEAIAVMAKYHGDGDANSPLVQLQLQQITDDFARTRSDNPWWDFRELANTRAARYRLMMVIAMAFFGQWSGNNVVSYFLPSMLKQAGIVDSNKQLLINAINPIFSMLAAVYGATLLDKLGRRKMLMGGLTGGLAAYVMLTAFTANTTSSNGLVYGVIVSIYLFGICFAWGWTPLQTLYSVECLENRTRAKGSGLNFLFLNIAMVVNTYGISVGMEAIGWKLYLVFIGWICVELAFIFL